MQLIEDSNAFLSRLSKADGEMSGADKFFREIDVAKQISTEILQTITNPELPVELQQDLDFKKTFEEVRINLTEILESKMQNQEYLHALKATQKTFFELVRKYNLIYSVNRDTKSPEQPIISSKFIFAQEKSK